MFKRFTLPALLLALALPLASCDKDDDDTVVTPVAQPTLYDNLGKVGGITGVVDEFVGNVIAEATSGPASKLSRTFQPLITDVTVNGNDARLRLFKQNLIDQIGQAAGGPLVYKGKSMPDAHAGMRITDDEFTALVTALSQALDTKGVAANDKATLLGVLGGLQSSIVNK